LDDAFFDIVRYVSDLSTYEVSHTQLRRVVIKRETKYRSYLAIILLFWIKNGRMKICNLYYWKVYYHSVCQLPVRNGASAAPTSEVRTAAMLVLFLIWN